MAQFIKNSKRNPLERSSSQGLVLGCPICAAKLDLLDTRDGDQAYWCHRCQSGWRAGNLPEAAHRSKDIVIPEPQVEAVPPALQARVSQNPRVSKTITAVPDAPRANAKQPAARLVAPKRGASPRAVASPPKPAVTTKPSRPSPRAADVAPSPLKTAAPKNALNAVQKKPSLETSLTDSRRAAQVAAPISKPVKAKRQPLEVAAKPSRATQQKSQKQALEIIASAPRPKRPTRPTLETTAPIKAPLPRVKRAQQPALAGKGLRTPAAPNPKAAIGKRQRLEVAVKPKISTPRAAAQKLLEIGAKITTPRAKPSGREQPVLETSKGARNLVQIVAPSPKATPSTRQKLEAAAPKISSARAAPQKPQKKTLESAAPLKALRRKKPILEIAPVASQKTRQRKPAPAVESTPKPRRTNARAATPLKPARAIPEQRKSRNAPIGKAQTAPVSQSRAKRPTAPLEPISKSRRAPRRAAQPSAR